MKMRAQSTSFFSLLILTLVTQLTGCIFSSDTRDYYSEVAFNADGSPLCAYTTLSSIPWSFATPDARLREDCKKALEAILPYDSNGTDTFKDAPPGLKDKLTEAFQTIVGYRLALPPQNTILGASPGAISAWHVNVLSSEGNINKTLFNLILRGIDNIQYEKNPVGSKRAEFIPSVDSKATLKVYSKFIEADQVLSLDLPSWFRGATTLAHEGWHGLGFFHSQCETGEFQCDNDLNGPYGMSIVYLEMLLHGSGKTHADGTSPSLTKREVTFTVRKICSLLKEKFDQLPTDLKSLLASTNCESISYQWVLVHEQLRR